MKTVKTSKSEALAKFLECDAEEIFETSYCFEHKTREYLVLTDEEADEKTREYILDTAWAFNKYFLDSHSEAISEIDDKTFAKLQEQCDGINKAIIKMIDDIDYFVDDAIAVDGRGHFLAGYDFEETEVDGYYIYRIN